MSASLFRLCVIAALIVSGMGNLPCEELGISLFVHALARNPESAAAGITRWAEDEGGYFTFRSAERVVIRIPGTSLPGLRSEIEKLEGAVLRYEPSTSDLSAELRAVRAAVRSREESLRRILDLMSDSDVGATLAFERELRLLNEEIEYYRGRERRLVNDGNYALVTIELSSEQNSIPDYLPSPFPWIESLGLYSFLESAP